MASCWPSCPAPRSTCSRSCCYVCGWPARSAGADWPGLRHANIIDAGEGRFCIIAEWDDLDALGAARPQMIATLDRFRDCLEDQGGGLGLTDPVSGTVVKALK